MQHPKMISIWFFIGVILVIYGILITGASVYDLSQPAEHPVVLAELHAGIWWGIFMLLLGGWYTFRFLPRK